MIDLKVLHRSLATAIESYRVEKGAYPPQLGLTTTPIAYIASLDSFDDGPYRTRYSTVKDGWILVSDGPDGIFQLSSWRALDASSFVIYDPTNGATSDGDIIRTNLGVLDLSHLPEFVDVPDETDSPESEP